MLSLDDRIKLLKDDLIADPPSFVMTREFARHNWPTLIV